MRLSEIEGKEIINISDGEKLGVVGDSDLAFNESTGAIEAMILPEKDGLLGSLLRDRREVTVPWTAIKKIGPEIIIVDLPDKHYALARGRR